MILPGKRGCLKARSPSYPNENTIPFHSCWSSSVGLFKFLFPGCYGNTYLRDITYNSCARKQDANHTAIGHANHTALSYAHPGALIHNERRSFGTLRGINV